MKDTCKSWLQVLTACIGLSATTWGQSYPQGFPQQPANNNIPQTDPQLFADQDVGTVRLGGADLSASAAVPAPGVAQTQFVPGAPPMFDDALVPQDDSIGFASTGMIEDRILWRVGRSNIDRYGFNDGYTNINAFIPFSIDSDRSLWWLNPRLNLTDDSEGAASVGFGSRVYVPEDDRVYGASFWWDYDNGHQGTYHQLGGSFESLGRYTDLRMNFSIPIGDQVSSVLTGVGSSEFIGNSIAVQQFINREEALQTYDFEAATPMPGLGQYGIDFGLGFYLLRGSDSDNTFGVSVRTQAQINDNFWLNALYTDDDTFGSNFSINFELTMPSSAPVRWFRHRAVAASLTDSVIRRYRVPVATSIGAIQVTAVNPKTGQSFRVAHIDPDAASTGTGSVSDPFMSLAEYAALPEAQRRDFDIVYVQPRADVSDTNLNTGIDLFSGQYLLSSSVPHFLQANAGVFQVPGFVPNQELPMLSSTGIMGDGHVVTLESGGNCFQIAGFDISREMTVAGPNAGVGSAIFGDNVSEVNINRNILRNAEYGTNLTSFSGSLSYTQNILRDNTVGGLHVDYTGDGHLALFSNSTSNNMGAGFEIVADGVTITADNPPETIPVAPSTIDPSFTGLNSILDLSDPDVDADVIPFDTSRMRTGIVGNVADLNETGMLLNAINGGQIIASVEGNLFSNNQDIATGGFVANAEGAGSTISFPTFQGNTFQFNVGNGALLTARDGGTIVTPLQLDPLDPDMMAMIPGFTGNLFSENDRNGLAVVVDNSTLNDLVIGGNEFSFNGESGFAAYLNDATFNNWEFDANLFDGNDRDGLAIVMRDSISNEVLVTNNEITNNGGNGINVIGVNSEITDMLIESNLIQGNGAPVSEFDINVVFLGGLTPAQQALFSGAARRWESMIIGDLPDVTDPQFGLIDDILITAEGVPLGPGILGQATFTAQRNDPTMLPYLGFMEFSTAFLPTLPAAELNDVILHEMAHVLGFNPGLWNQVGLIDVPNALFLGNSATAEHNALFGVNDPGVPLENDTGSPGSDFAHWEDQVYGDELMTFSATGTAPRKITRVTVAQFQDLGYVVDLNAADQTFPITAGPTTPSLGFNKEEPNDAQITANEQKLAAYFANPALTLPLDDPGVETQLSIGGNSGINFDLTDSVVNVTARDNIVDQNLDSNLRAELHGASTFNLNSTRNMYTASQSASGVEVITHDTSVATLDIQNTTITDNVANGILGNTFNGSQLSISVTSPLDPDFVGFSTISDNNQNGISVISSADSPSVNTSIVDILIDSVVFDSNGLRGVDILAREFSTFDVDIQNSFFTGNGTDGIGTTRMQDAFINGTFLTNTISGNGEVGIELLSQNSNTIDTYLIQDNIIRSNERGIHLRVEADAVIDAIINRNLIEQNSSHGIHVTDRANSALDQRNVIGIWTQNDILSNGGNGIFLSGSYGIDSPLVIGQNGVDVDGFSLGNVINGNGAWGIQSDAVGNATIDNNLITENGSGGINIASSLIFGNSIGIDNNFIGQNGGIGIELLAQGAVILQVDATNNTITDNRGDGVELATLDFASSFVTLDNNIIFINDGRGIDILNAGAGPDSTVNLLNNTVDANGGEGVYVVNTASRSQFNSKDGATPGTFVDYGADPTHGMDATGSIFADPTLLLNMDNNSITNNGELSLFDATGFVLRVGTSDGGFGFTFEGGYASEGFGGVVANITNNVFSGNFGTDVWFESFTSTAPPPVTAGNWTDTAFNFTAPYRSDPLARLDLVFSGNTGNSADVTQVGAWYNNAEPVFKSRQVNANQNAPGPFSNNGGATRRRNAQRLASRDDPFFGPLPPFTPFGLQFLYPGLGTSTFRIAAGTTIGFTGSGADNEFDILGSTFNTLIFPNPNILFGEEPYGWDTTSYIP